MISSLNYANPDMVGHTDPGSSHKGNRRADTRVGRVVDAVRKTGIAMVIADHECGDDVDITTAALRPTTFGSVQAKKMALRKIKTPRHLSRRPQPFLYLMEIPKPLRWMDRI
jgi:bisphosphoglycerate-independent phosphoglycerate mutase (AlkP superfamily)